MKRRLFKTMAAVLAIAAAAAGPVRGQNASPDVILDFTDHFSWDIPTSGTTTATESYTNGTYSITLSATSNYRLNSGYLLLGKNDSYLQLPAFESAVDSIVVVGRSGASGNVNQNIYVGETAVSTQTMGATDSNTYVIDPDYRAAGNIYTLKVDNGYNTQITYIKVYCSTPPTPHTVRFAAGNDGWQVQDVTAGSAAVTAPAVLQNVMAGDSLVVTAPATLPGKVKSVKAVKYVAPAATVATAPTATGAVIEVGSTAALVNAGAASGGTMMYAVTTTNAQPASTADFSASIPTAEGREAGTYYVWFYAKADAEHSDGEIAGPVSVTLAVMITVTWNSTNVFNSANQNDWLNQWNPAPLTYEGITISFSGERVSSFYPYDGAEQRGSLKCFGDEGDSFTFTAPDGKKFCKIEIINNGGITFTNYGDWTQPAYNKAVWSGTAASTVTLDTVYTVALELNSIVFKLIDAQ